MKATPSQVESATAKASLLNRIGGYLLAKSVLSWMSTLSYRAYDEYGVDPVSHAHDPAPIYLMWHEYIPILYYLRPGKQVAVLLSNHRDAELLSQASVVNGYRVFRGSTNRGGVRALKHMMESLGDLSLCLTPDGPRGPRQEIAPGCIFLASKMQRPIIPLGLGYDRPFRVKKSWDQFAIPIPFRKTRVVFGKKIWVEEGVRKEAFEEARLRVQHEMDRVTQLADQWANRKISLEPSFKIKRCAQFATCETPLAAPHESNAGEVVADQSDPRQQTSHPSHTTVDRPHTEMRPKLSDHSSDTQLQS